MVCVDTMATREENTASIELRDVDAATKGHEVKPHTLGACSESLESYELPSVPPPHLSFNARQQHIAAATLNTSSSSSRARLQDTCLIVRIFVKLTGVGFIGVVLLIAVLHWPPWVVENGIVRAQTLSALFACGLLLVALEDVLGINKSAVMLLLAASMWTFVAVGFHPNQSQVGAHQLHHELNRGLQEVGSVILFLLPAMGVVESIDHFDGFEIVTFVIRKVMAGKHERMIPIICTLTFFLSSVIDNLTATIVALKILHHVTTDTDSRCVCGGLVVIAANSGGAWSPIGDVTTTMLWIRGKITAPRTVRWLLFPSLVSGLLPFVGMWWWMHLKKQSRNVNQPSRRRSKPRQGEDSADGHAEHDQENAPLKHFDEDDQLCGGVTTPAKVATLAMGIVCILMVPVLKMCTGLPPYLGMLLALGLVWLITDAFLLSDTAAQIPASDMEPIIDGNAPAHHTGPPCSGVVQALHKLDLTGLLFFTGVLLAVGALDSAGILRSYATFLVDACGHSPLVLCTLLGLSSAVVDNVPLVEATIDMFDSVPADDPLWQLVALAAGTGGSILSIGSIAGVTLMSMEGVGFLWYCQRISVWAVAGFGLGILTYQVERFLFG